MKTIITHNDLEISIYQKEKEIPKEPKKKAKEPNYRKQKRVKPKIFNKLSKAELATLLNRVAYLKLLAERGLI